MRKYSGNKGRTICFSQIIRIVQSVVKVKVIVLTPHQNAIAWCPLRNIQLKCQMQSVIFLHWCFVSSHEKRQTVNNSEIDTSSRSPFTSSIQMIICGNRDYYLGQATEQTKNITWDSCRRRFLVPVSYSHFAFLINNVSKKNQVFFIPC